jgi:hypothetical protein
MDEIFVVIRKGIQCPFVHLRGRPLPVAFVDECEEDNRRSLVRRRVCLRIPPDMEVSRALPVGLHSAEHSSRFGRIGGVPAFRRLGSLIWYRSDGQE